jgi:hypothetical protein
VQGALVRAMKCFQCKPGLLDWRWASRVLLRNGVGRPRAKWKQPSLRQPPLHRPPAKLSDAGLAQIARARERARTGTGSVVVSAILSLCVEFTRDCVGNNIDELHHLRLADLHVLGIEALGRRF